MSVHTNYDEKRDELRDNLKDCLKLARELLDDNIWGYSDMRADYAEDVYRAVKAAYNEV